MSVAKMIVSFVNTTSGHAVVPVVAKSLEKLSLEQLDMLAKNLYNISSVKNHTRYRLNKEMITCLSDKTYFRQLEMYLKYRKKINIDLLCKIIATDELDNGIIKRLLNEDEFMLEDIVNACVATKQDLLDHPFMKPSMEDDEKLTFLKIASTGVILDSYGKVELFNLFPYENLIDIYTLTKYGLTENDILLMRKTPKSIDFFCSMIKILKLPVKPTFDNIVSKRFIGGKTIFDINHYELDLLLLMLQKENHNPVIVDDYIHKYNLVDREPNYKILMPEYFYHRLGIKQSDVEIETQSGYSAFVLMAHLLESYFDKVTLNCILSLFDENTVSISVIHKIFKIATSEHKDSMETYFHLLENYDILSAIIDSEEINAVKTPKEFYTYEDFLFSVFKRAVERELMK